MGMTRVYNEYEKLSLTFLFFLTRRRDGETRHHDDGTKLFSVNFLFLIIISLKMNEKRAVDMFI